MIVPDNFLKVIQQSSKEKTVKDEQRLPADGKTL